MGDEEFPLLGSLGLYASSTTGDGNCLFNALSDQLYGHQNEHAAIRARVIEYMREHAAYYKQFMDVHPGGGIRRNPKRKNAGAYSTPANYAPPSEADIDRVFEGHMHRMAQGGTYGDNMEIVAFAAAYGVDVKIYQRDFAYMVTSGSDEIDPQVAHIAYHLWEHYSSIRNLDGPHSGPPNVSPKVLTLEQEQEQQEKLARSSVVQPWMIDTVFRSLPYLPERSAVVRALEAGKGNVNAVVSNMMDEWYGSTSSQQESSSVERDHDSDDDLSNGPNKKRDRRMSKASRLQQGRSAESRHALSQLVTSDGSQDSIGSYDSENSSVPDSMQQSNLTQRTVIRVTDHDANTVDDTSASRSESPANKPSVRLKLLPPKPPNGKTQQQQLGPRARDRKAIKKQAQKTARKEREQAAIRDVARSQSPSAAGLALRQKGMTDTPPVVDTLRTLYI